MTVENTLPDTQVRQVFIYTGNVIHLLDTKRPLGPDEKPDRARALCGTAPWWPGIWFSPADYKDRVDNWPTCSMCLRAKEALGSE